MNIKILEEYNQAKLPRKYHKTAAGIDNRLFDDIVRSWEEGDRQLYIDTIKKLNCPSDTYYILAIWLHPMTKFQQLAEKVDKLREEVK